MFRIGEAFLNLKIFLINKRKAKIDLEQERARSLRILSDIFCTNVQSIYDQHKRSEFRSWYDKRKKELDALVGPNVTTSDFDCETLYLLVRLSKPSVVVETGVLFGASSSYILEALRDNGGGKLYSIDLPSEKMIPPKDFLVRDTDRRDWKLIIGYAEAELPKALNELGSIDYFHHDSTHTFKHQLYEYETAFKYLSKRGILSSHDVVHLPFFDKDAFKVFVKRHRLKNKVFRNMGIVFRDEGMGLR